jgi:sulfoxide reductase heme-binding subunit YedZ
VVDDVIKRPFITAGMVAFVLMVPLAITSTSGSVRRLGFKMWDRLHKLVYIAAILAAIHFILRVKLDLIQPLTYAYVLATLFIVRVVFWASEKIRGPKKKVARA